MQAHWKFISALAVIFLWSASAGATPVIVNFDDLDAVASADIPIGYGGINWTTAWELTAPAPFNPLYPAESLPNEIAGIRAGASFSFSAPVRFIGMYFSGPFNLSYDLYLNGVKTDTENVSLGINFNAPNSSTFSVAAYTGLTDEVVVNGLAGFYTVDDVTFEIAPTTPSSIPEPPPWGILLTSLAGMILVTMRARRKSRVTTPLESMRMSAPESQRAADDEYNHSRSLFLVDSWSGLPTAPYDLH